MPFLVTNINSALALTNEMLPADKNIDQLSKSLLDSSMESSEQLQIATKCVNLCEKFHSYFHYEQSFFHLLLGKKTRSISEYEAAILQDPMNYEAKHLLNNLQTDTNIEFPYILYTRDFQNFSDFLKLVIDDNVINYQYLAESYWDYYDRFIATDDIQYLIKTLEMISMAHQKYHNNAAKIYYNRHLVFKNLDNEILAKNDLIKAKNLDHHLLN